MKSGSMAAMAAGVAMLVPGAAHAQTVEELQAQINELKAMVKALCAAQASATCPPTDKASASAAPPAAAPSSGTPAGGSPAAAGSTPVMTAAAQPAPAPAAEAPAAEAPAPRSKAWYEKVRLRGYTQMRYNAIISGDETAPADLSRLRSVHDSSISDRGNFSLRRVRLVLEGDISDRVSIYLQPDFASAVSNQSGGERREHYVQLRDAYADVFLDDKKTFKLRLGQSKVPFGWENLQSSSNRLTLDRSDAINSGVPSERELGVVAYYTPAGVQRIWDRLSDDGVKLFGNYGAFGFGLFNGQGVNRSEQNKNLMKVAMATWPFELDGLGFNGQVFEIGGTALMNQVKPEIRAGGVSATNFDDERVSVHAMLYPQPFGVQAEWTWGRGPEFDIDSQSIRTRKLDGGYVQAMYRLQTESVGTLMPYARWQYYRGGWKAATNAPRLETDEIELGVEWQPMKALELTLAYARMKRSEADERRMGRAEGDLIRTQIQWNY